MKKDYFLFLSGLSCSGYPVENGGYQTSSNNNTITEQIELDTTQALVQYIRFFITNKRAIRYIHAGRRIKLHTTTLMIPQRDTFQKRFYPKILLCLSESQIQIVGLTRSLECTYTKTDPNYHPIEK